MTDAETPTNTVEVDFSEERPPITRREAPFCHHWRIELDEKTRMCLCLTCGGWLTPWEYLWAVARRDENLAARGNRYESEAKALTDRIEELKKEERNIKARVKRAAGNLPLGLLPA